jgi:hypothetical protein
VITNFIEQNIRRATRNLLIANILLAGALAVIVALNARYLYNVVRGPFDIDRAALLRLTDTEKRQEYYVNVKADEVLDTGVQEVTSSTRNGVNTGERVTANFVALVVDARLLLARAPVSDTGTSVTGALVPIPQDVQREIIDDIITSEPSLDGIFLPYMLDAGDFRTGGYIGLALCGALALLALWNLTRAVRRAVNPEAHPTYRALAVYGPGPSIIASVDGEVSNPACTKIAGAYITPHWLVQTSTFGVEVTRVDDLIWIYKKVTQRRVSFVPAGTTHAAVLWNRQGKSIEINGNELQVTDILMTVARQVPWIFVGYTADLEKAWQKNRAAMMQAVAERQREARGQSAFAPAAREPEGQRG